MRVSRIETVIQFVSDRQASSRCKPGTGRGGTGCWFLPDSVTFDELEGNIVGLIDNSKGGMPRKRA